LNKVPGILLLGPRKNPGFTAYAAAAITKSLSFANIVFSACFGPDPDT